MQGDFQLLADDSGCSTGSRRFTVAASATTIKSGEPVGISALGDVAVIPMATNLPLATTGLMVGIATSDSTNTATAAGTVDVMLVTPLQTWLVKPKVAATWDTAAEYAALVGKRVLIDLTSGAYTVLAADSANNGAVVQPIDITKYPGRVAVSFRAGCSFLA